MLQWQSFLTAGMKSVYYFSVHLPTAARNDRHRWLSCMHFSRTSLTLSTVARLRAGRLRNRCLNPLRGKRVQIGSGAHPAICPVVCRDSLSGGKVDEVPDRPLVTPWSRVIQHKLAADVYHFILVLPGFPGPS
jgi:hypothetical protein